MTDAEIMQKLRTGVDNNIPMPLGLSGSWYIYAEDYYRRTRGLPLRVRAAGQYYLDEDTYGIERTLPFDSRPSIPWGDAPAQTVEKE